MSKIVIKKLIENLSINRTNGTNHVKKTNSIRNHKRIFSAVPALTILIGTLALVNLFSIASSALTANSAYASQPTHSASTSSKVSVNVSDIIAIRIMNLDGTTELDNLTLDLLPTPKGAFTSNSLSVETSTTNTTGYKLYIGAIGEDSDGTVTNALVNTTSSDTESGSSSGSSSASSNSDSTSSNNTSSSSTTSTTSTTSNGTSSVSSSSNGSSNIIPALSSSNVTEADYSKDNSPYKNSWGFSTNATTKTDGTATYNPVPALSTNSTNYNTNNSNSNSSNTDSSNTDSSSTNTNDSSVSSNGSYDPSGTAAIVRDNTTTAVEQELTPVTIGVNASSSLNAGTYTNTLEFTAVANPVPVDFSLSFNANTDGSGGSDGTVTNLPEGLTATAIASSYTFTLPDTVPAREGYIFAGWTSTTDSSGTVYFAGDSYEVIADDSDPYSANGVLYAKWVALPAFYTISTMQEMTNAICNSVVTPSKDATMADTTGTHMADNSYVPENTLTDTRDNNTYAVRKLADGNCWMSENLKLDLEVGIAVTIASTTSSGTSTWTPVANTGSANNTVPMNSNTVKNSDNGLWYYNWFAATGNSGTTSMDSNKEAPYSICPQNWRLPPNYSVNSAKSYQTLMDSYNITDSNWPPIENFPLNFTRSGRYDNGNLMNTKIGYYWSSTAYSANNAYRLYYDSGSVLPQVHDYKYAGIPVRCVAQ